MKTLLAMPVDDGYMTALYAGVEDPGKELNKYHIFPGAAWDLLVSKSFSNLLGRHRLPEVSLSADDSVKVLKNGRIMIRRPEDMKAENKRYSSLNEILNDAERVYVFHFGRWDVIRKESVCQS